MEIWSSFYQQVMEASALQYLAVISGIVGIWLSKQEKVLFYPFWIISVSLTFFLTSEKQLYAEAGINAYYFFMSIYGWWHWRHPKDLGANQIPITKSEGWGNYINLGTFVLATIFIYIMLIRFSDSDVPLIDAITTGLAVTAMYLMALKKIEHWYFWIASYLLSVPLYIYKDLPIFSFQFMVLLAIAVLGLLSWRRKLMMGQS